MQSEPPGNALASPVPKVEALWQVREAVIENNLIELMPSRNDVVTAVGINFYGPLPEFIIVRPDLQFDPRIHFVFRNVLVRNNVIRYVAGPSGSPLPASRRDVAVALLSVENGRIEQNVIDVPSANVPFRHQYGKTVRYFNNTGPSGQFIPGALTLSGVLVQQWPDLATLSEDAATLALF